MRYLIILFVVALSFYNCKTSSTKFHSSRVAQLKLATAAYDITTETSAKACSYEIGWFNREGMSTDRTADLVAKYNFFGAYYRIIEVYVLTVVGGSDAELSVEGAAVHRAIKKVDGGDVLLDYKTTTTTDGFFFPDVCVTVSGKAASLTGPSVTAKK
ncbi:hypothetical protein ND860_01230 [Leptospira levettii]|uniref:hypothetical protein n=1 Tax=Leptospira levettii TaxID=2023178 RepID=UPI000C29AC21|nr:hypothetical protein [Leptospira levettii]MCW7495128.1 hypothetical protein [Leptospira levettii]PKA28288.1 hypothetical protein CH381_00285 [Leptospira sp. mixed culture ATI2-C-A1]